MKNRNHSVLLTYLIAGGSPLFYCSIGVFVKSAYTYEVDAILRQAINVRRVDRSIPVATEMPSAVVGRDLQDIRPFSHA